MSGLWVGVSTESLCPSAAVGPRLRMQGKILNFFGLHLPLLKQLFPVCSGKKTVDQILQPSQCIPADTWIKLWGQMVQIVSKNGQQGDKNWYRTQNDSWIQVFLCSIVYVGSRKDHRITEWFALDRSLKDISFQPLCLGQQHLPLDQVAQRPHPAWPWTPPGMRHPQLLCATCCSASPPLQ